MYNVDAGLLAEDNYSFLTFDENGFLINPENWNHETAQQISIRNGVQKLEKEHLNIMQYIRDYYFEMGSFATPRVICSKLDVDKTEMKRFFGGCINAWKIAGLPDPGEEARTYMS